LEYVPRWRGLSGIGLLALVVGLVCPPLAGVIGI